MTREEYIERAKTKFSTALLVFSAMGLLFIVLSLSLGDVTMLRALPLIFIGIMLWTLIEYFLHRFPFHWKITKEPWNMYVSEFHFIHHEYPNARNLVIAPIQFSLVVYIVILGALTLITGAWATTLILGTGIIIGYLAYEWTHTFTHFGKPKTRLGRYLKEYHMIHHFKDSDNYFGVTSPLWDIVFGTKPKLDRTASSHILPIISRGPQI